MRQEGGDLCLTTFFWYPFLSGLPFLKGGQKMKEGKKERRTFHQIGHNQRTSILAMLEKGCSIQEIAKRLHRHPSTIYREIRRCPVSKEGEGYQYGKGCKDLPYVKISTSDIGRIKIVNSDSKSYKTDGKEKAKILFRRKR